MSTRVLAGPTPEDHEAHALPRRGRAMLGNRAPGAEAVLREEWTSGDGGQKTCSRSAA